MELKFLEEEYTSPPKRKKTFLAILLILIAVSLFLIIIYTINNIPTPTVKNIITSDSSRLSSLLTTDQQTSSIFESNSSNFQVTFRQSSDWKLVLINNENVIPSDFQLQIQDYYGAKVDKRIVSSYEEMKKSAEKEKVTLWISSGYRSIDRQKLLFEQEVERSIAKGLSHSASELIASKTVAKPGHSEHNTGLALDLNGVSPTFESSKAFIWLQRHAAEFGFILRFPKDKTSITGMAFEPWHYRYVGKENALKIRSSGKCLEEYLKAA